MLSNTVYMNIIDAIAVDEERDRDSKNEIQLTQHHSADLFDRKQLNA